MLFANEVLVNQRERTWTHLAARPHEQVTRGTVASDHCLYLMISILRVQSSGSSPCIHQMCCWKSIMCLGSLLEGQELSNRGIGATKAHLQDCHVVRFLGQNAGCNLAGELLPDVDLLA